MDITIRKATFQDREALCRIHVSSIRELGKSHYSEGDIAAWSSGRTPQRYGEHILERYVVVAVHKTIPVGFGTLDLSIGEILQLYVSPEYARKGVGTLILDDLLMVAKSSGLHEIRLLASLNAKDFYIHAGFEAGQVCKHQLRNGGEVDCIPMKKYLG